MIFSSFILPSDHGAVQVSRLHCAASHLWRKNLRIGVNEKPVLRRVIILSENFRAAYVEPDSPPLPGNRAIDRACLRSRRQISQTVKKPFVDDSWRSSLLKKKRFFSKVQKRTPGRNSRQNVLDSWQQPEQGIRLKI